MELPQTVISSSIMRSVLHCTLSLRNTDSLAFRLLCTQPAMALPMAVSYHFAMHKVPRNAKAHCPSGITHYAKYTDHIYIEKWDS